MIVGVEKSAVVAGGHPRAFAVVVAPVLHPYLRTNTTGWPLSTARHTRPVFAMGHVEDNGIAAFTDAPTFQPGEGRLFSAYLPPLWCGAQNRERTIDKNVGIIGPIYIFGNDERSRHVHVQRHDYGPALSITGAIVDIRSMPVLWSIKTNEFLAASSLSSWRASFIGQPIDEGLVFLPPMNKIASFGRRGKTTPESLNVDMSSPSAIPSHVCAL
jgi:hypothetical protein